MRSLIHAIGSLAFCAAMAQAQTLEVPGDYFDLQTALDAAPADATIVVHGGHWFALTVTRPVRIVGDPMPYIWGDGQGQLESPITLAGPGSGDVVLSNVSVGMLVNSHAFVLNAPGIQGGGFDGLFVYDSTVNGPEWEFVYNHVFPGAPAIETTVPLVWIERSTVEGSRTAADPNNLHSPSSNPTPLGAPGGTAIIAPLIVVLIDSSIRGGDGDRISYESPACNFPCPGGDGGHGVVCWTLLHRGSTIRPGGPSSWYTETGVDLCCRGTRGKRSVVTNELTMPPPRPAPNGNSPGTPGWRPARGVLLGSTALEAPRNARIGWQVARELAERVPTGSAR